MMNENFIIPKWPAPENVRAIQTTRNGGTSLEKFSTLNLSNNVGDIKQHVDDNYKKLLNFLPSDPFWLNQIHSNKSEEIPSTKNLNCDASYTYNKETVCAVRTADCLPIFLTNFEASFVGVIHAGWRGLLNGVIEKTIDKIRSPSEIIVWLGPCISQESFEVGNDVYDLFINKDSNIKKAFKLLKNRYYLDLALGARLKLNYINIKNISGTGVTEDFCTFREKEKFFSYRRDGKTGRMASLLWIDS
ncbi:peptidoglycan editing factor PgeF [Methylophilaceae bacterium]|jgi:polyphenol oxidase|nr:peptidoglycan editing factor PgeF [Methylophilaceae bacterium]|tara:strand:- start:218 stop:955 length:738 start_codon:yes stop_codon:yes gene_type:complete